MRQSTLNKNDNYDYQRGLSVPFHEVTALLALRLGWVWLADGFE